MLDEIVVIVLVLVVAVVGDVFVVCVAGSIVFIGAIVLDTSDVICVVELSVVVTVVLVTMV